MAHLSTYSRSCCKKKGVLKGAGSIQASVLSHRKRFVPCFLGGNSQVLSNNGREGPNPIPMNWSKLPLFLLVVSCKSGASDWNRLCTKWSAGAVATHCALSRWEELPSPFSLAQSSNPLLLILCLLPKDPHILKCCLCPTTIHHSQGRKVVAYLFLLSSVGSGSPRIWIPDHLLSG